MDPVSEWVLRDRNMRPVALGDVLLTRQGHRVILTGMEPPDVSPLGSIILDDLDNPTNDRSKRHPGVCNLFWSKMTPVEALVFTLDQITTDLKEDDDDGPY